MTRLKRELLKFENANNENSNNNWDMQSKIDEETKAVNALEAKRNRLEAIKEEKRQRLFGGTPKEPTIVEPTEANALTGKHGGQRFVKEGDQLWQMDNMVPQDMSPSDLQAINIYMAANKQVLDGENADISGRAANGSIGKYYLQQTNTDGVVKPGYMRGDLPADRRYTPAMDGYGYAPGAKGVNVGDPNEAELRYREEDARWLEGLNLWNTRDLATVKRQPGSSQYSPEDEVDYGSGKSEYRNDEFLKRIYGDSGQPIEQVMARGKELYDKYRGSSLKDRLVQNIRDKQDKYRDTSLVGGLVNDAKIAGRSFLGMGAGIIDSQMDKFVTDGNQGLMKKIMPEDWIKDGDFVGLDEWKDIAKYKGIDTTRLDRAEESAQDLAHKMRQGTWKWKDVGHALVDGVKAIDQVLLNSSAEMVMASNPITSTVLFDAKLNEFNENRLAFKKKNNPNAELTVEDRVIDAGMSAVYVVANHLSAGGLAWAKKPFTQLGLKPITKMIVASGDSLVLKGVINSMAAGARAGVAAAGETAEEMVQTSAEIMAERLDNMSGEALNKLVHSEKAIEEVLTAGIMAGPSGAGMNVGGQINNRYGKHGLRLHAKLDGVKRGSEEEARIRLDHENDMKNRDSGIRLYKDWKKIKDKDSDEGKAKVKKVQEKLKAVFDDTASKEYQEDIKTIIEKIGSTATVKDKTKVAYSDKEDTKTEVEIAAEKEKFNNSVETWIKEAKNTDDKGLEKKYNMLILGNKLLDKLIEDGNTKKKDELGDLLLNMTEEYTAATQLDDDTVLGSDKSIKDELSTGGKLDTLAEDVLRVEDEMKGEDKDSDKWKELDEKRKSIYTKLYDAVKIDKNLESTDMLSKDDIDEAINKKRAHKAMINNNAYSGDMIDLLTAKISNNNEEADKIEGKINDKMVEKANNEISAKLAKPGKVGRQINAVLAPVKQTVNDDDKLVDVETELNEYQSVLHKLELAKEYEKLKKEKSPTSVKRRVALSKAIFGFTAVPTGVNLEEFVGEIKNSLEDGTKNELINKKKSDAGDILQDVQVLESIAKGKNISEKSKKRISEISKNVTKQIAKNTEGKKKKLTQKEKNIKSRIAMLDSEYIGTVDKLNDNKKEIKNSLLKLFKDNYSKIIKKLRYNKAIMESDWKLNTKTKRFALVGKLEEQLKANKDYLAGLDKKSKLKDSDKKNKLETENLIKELEKTIKKIDEMGKIQSEISKGVKPNDINVVISAANKKWKEIEKRQAGLESSVVMYKKGIDRESQLMEEAEDEKQKAKHGKNIEKREKIIAKAEEEIKEIEEQKELLKTHKAEYAELVKVHESIREVNKEDADEAKTKEVVAKAITAIKEIKAKFAKRLDAKLNNGKFTEVQKKIVMDYVEDPQSETKAKNYKEFINGLEFRETNEIDDAVMISKIRDELLDESNIDAMVKSRGKTSTNTPGEYTPTLGKLAWAINNRALAVKAEEIKDYSGFNFDRRLFYYIGPKEMLEAMTNMLNENEKIIEALDNVQRAKGEIATLKENLERTFESIDTTKDKLAIISKDDQKGIDRLKKKLTMLDTRIDTIKNSINEKNAVLKKSNDKLKSLRKVKQSKIEDVQDMIFKNNPVGKQTKGEKIDDLFTIDIVTEIMNVDLDGSDAVSKWMEIEANEFLHMMGKTKDTKSPEKGIYVNANDEWLEKDYSLQLMLNGIKEDSTANDVQVNKNVLLAIYSVWADFTQGELAGLASNDSEKIDKMIAGVKNMLNSEQLAELRTEMDNGEFSRNVVMALGIKVMKQIGLKTDSMANDKFAKEQAAVALGYRVAQIGMKQGILVEHTKTDGMINMTKKENGKPTPMIQIKGKTRTARQKVAKNAQDNPLNKVVSELFGKKENRKPAIQMYKPETITTAKIFNDELGGDVDDKTLEALNAFNQTGFKTLEEVADEVIGMFDNDGKERERFNKATGFTPAEELDTMEPGLALNAQSKNDDIESTIDKLREFRKRRIDRNMPEVIYFMHKVLGNGRIITNINGPDYQNDKLIRHIMYPSDQKSSVNIQFDKDGNANNYSTLVAMYSIAQAFGVGIDKVYPEEVVAIGKSVYDWTMKNGAEKLREVVFGDDPTGMDTIMKNAQKDYEARQAKRVGKDSELFNRIKKMKSKELEVEELSHSLQVVSALKQLKENSGKANVVMQVEYDGINNGSASKFLQFVANMSITKEDEILYEDTGDGIQFTKAGLNHIEHVKKQLERTGMYDAELDVINGISYRLDNEIDDSYVDMSKGMELVQDDIERKPLAKLVKENDNEVMNAIEEIVEAKGETADKIAKLKRELAKYIFMPFGYGQRIISSIKKIARDSLVDNMRQGFWEVLQKEYSELDASDKMYKLIKPIYRGWLENQEDTKNGNSDNSNNWDIFREKFKAEIIKGNELGLEAVTFGKLGIINSEILGVSQYGGNEKKINGLRNTRAQLEKEIKELDPNDESRLKSKYEQLNKTKKSILSLEESEGFVSNRRQIIGLFTDIVEASMGKSIANGLSKSSQHLIDGNRRVVNAFSATRMIMSKAFELEVERFSSGKDTITKEDEQAIFKKILEKIKPVFNANGLDVSIVDSDKVPVENEQVQSGVNKHRTGKTSQTTQIVRVELTNAYQSGAALPTQNIDGSTQRDVATEMELEDGGVNFVNIFDALVVALGDAIEHSVASNEAFANIHENIDMSLNALEMLANTLSVLGDSKEDILSNEVIELVNADTEEMVRNDDITALKSKYVEDRPEQVFSPMNNEAITVEEVFNELYDYTKINIANRVMLIGDDGLDVMQFPFVEGNTVNGDEIVSKGTIELPTQMDSVAKSFVSAKQINEMVAKFTTGRINSLDELNLDQLGKLNNTGEHTFEDKNSLPSNIQAATKAKLQADVKKVVNSNASLKKAFGLDNSMVTIKGVNKKVSEIINILKDADSSIEAIEMIDKEDGLGGLILADAYGSNENGVKDGIKEIYSIIEEVKQRRCKL